MRRGFKSWAEQQAVELRVALQRTATAPLPAALLAQHLGVCLVTPADIPGMRLEDLACLLRPGVSCWSALTVDTPIGRFIAYNTTHSQARHESDVMHELAHIICTHPRTRIVSIPGVPFPMREYHPDHEEEAIWLGACLQLPRDGLLWARRQGMDTEQIASYYGASREQVRYRLNTTGVEQQLRRGSTRISR